MKSGWATGDEERLASHPTSNFAAVVSRLWLLGAVAPEVHSPARALECFDVFIGLQVSSKFALVFHQIAF